MPARVHARDVGVQWETRKNPIREGFGDVSVWTPTPKASSEAQEIISLGVVSHVGPSTIAETDGFFMGLLKGRVDNHLVMLDVYGDGGF